MRNITLTKSRLLAKKISAPFYDWQESYLDLLHFEETSNHHQWISEDIEFYFFVPATDKNFFMEEAHLARSIFGPELIDSDHLFSFDLSPGTALRHEIHDMLWLVNWKTLEEEYKKATEKILKTGSYPGLSQTWRLKILNNKNIVMEFFTDNKQ